MTPKALYSGARMAMRLSRECQREGDQFEAFRHKERARDYLHSRRMVLKAILTLKEDDTHVSP
jgi:cytidylate kinase